MKSTGRAPYFAMIAASFFAVAWNARGELRMHRALAAVHHDDGVELPPGRVEDDLVAGHERVLADAVGLQVDCHVVPVEARAADRHRGAARSWRSGSAATDQVVVVAVHAVVVVEEAVADPEDAAARIGADIAAHRLGSLGRRPGGEREQQRQAEQGGEPAQGMQEGHGISSRSGGVARRVGSPHATQPRPTSEKLPYPWPRICVKGEQAPAIERPDRVRSAERSEDDSSLPELAP